MATNTIDDQYKALRDVAYELGAAVAKAKVDRAYAILEGDSVMSKKEQRYAMLVVRLPEDQSDVGVGHDTMLKCGEVVASCKRPLTAEQVGAVVHAMEGADSYVPGPTSGQAALGLSTREDRAAFALVDRMCTQGKGCIR